MFYPPFIRSVNILKVKLVKGHGHIIQPIIIRVVYVLNCLKNFNHHSLDLAVRKFEAMSGSILSRDKKSKVIVLGLE